MNGFHGNKKINKAAWLWRAVGEYLYPPKCIRCRSTEVCGTDIHRNVLLIDPDGERRGCFCSECMKNFLGSVREKCPLCGREAVACECSTDVLRSVGIEKVYSSFVYDTRNRKNASSAFIYALKRVENKDVINFAAYLIAGRLQKATFFGEKEFIVTYAPRRKSAIRQNGGDHMKMTAALASKIVGAEFRCLFSNRSRGAQKKKNAKDRISSAKSSIKLKKSAKNEVSGKNIVIIDDVVTSGATLAACALLLFKAGAESVEVVTLAKVKNYMAENGVEKGM